MFLRVLGSQIPSTSRSVTDSFVISNFISRRWISAEIVEKSNRVVEVKTTGFAFLDADGKWSGRYGVYWGPKDSRNVYRVMPSGTSHIAAMLTAILDVVNTAREENPPPPLIIYSELEQENFIRELTHWAKRDFYKRNNLEKMKNSDILRDIYLAIQGMNIKVVPRKFYVDGRNMIKDALLSEIREQKALEFEKNSNLIEEKFGNRKYCNTENPAEPDAELVILPGEEVDKFGKHVQSPRKWSKVYVGVVCKENKDYISAGYCTHWPNGECGGGRAYRFAPFPVTQFRATLAAIEEALKEARDMKIGKVVVVTNCALFMCGWKHRWIRSSGEHYRGLAFYERINDLCGSIGQVNFRYEIIGPQILNQVERKCKEGLRLPVIGRDRSEYELKIEDIVVSKAARNPSEQLIRIFKTGTDKNAGFVWDSNEIAMSSCGTPEIVISILEKAIEKNLDTIIIRSDSERLIKNFDAYMEVWRRSGWRNSQHKRIAKADLWEKAWNLKQKIHVSWEFMEEYDEEDRAENQRIPEYQKKSV